MELESLHCLVECKYNREIVYFYFLAVVITSFSKYAWCFYDFPSQGCFCKCTFCHTSGAAGAPKAHDEAAWKPLRAKGMDTLVKHVKEGYNAMPPKGTCADCSEDELRGAIKKMSGL